MEAEKQEAREEGESSDEVSGLPWPVFITEHALVRAQEKFKLHSREEAEAYIRAELGASTSTRRRRNGALRWTTDTTQLVTRESTQGIWVITCYPLPKGRQHYKQRKATWKRDHRRNNHNNARQRHDDDDAH